MFGEISTKGRVPHAISPYPELIESELDRPTQKGLKFQHVCSQDYRDWKWSLGLNKTMGVLTYLSTLGSRLKIIWCESVGRIVSCLIDINPCSKTAKIHQGSRWRAIWLAGGCGRASAMCLIAFVYIMFFDNVKSWYTQHWITDGQFVSCLNALKDFSCLFLVVSNVHVYVRALRVRLNGLSSTHFNLHVLVL